MLFSIEQAQPAVYLTERILQKMIACELQKVGSSLQAWDFYKS